MTGSSTAGDPRQGAAGGAALRRRLSAWVVRNRLMLVIAAVVSTAAAATAASLFLAPRSELPDPWLVALLGLLFLIADRPLLDIRFGHEQESFTWAEMCVVVGLALVALPVLVPVAAGAVLIYHLARRLPLVKALFNAACFAVGVALAGGALALAGSTGTTAMNAQQAGGLAAAALVFAVWSGVAVSGVVALSSGRRYGEVFRKGLLLRVFITAGNAVAGLVIVTLASVSRLTLLALPVLLLLLFSAYRAYLHAMEERDVWQQLEQATRELNGLEELQVAQAALRRARQLFRPDAVELLVLGRHGGAHLYTLVDDGEVQVQAVERHLGAFGTTTYVQLGAESGDERPRTCLSSPLDGPQGRIGALRLLFGGPVKLSGRERQVLSTFSHAVSSTLLNAALYDDMRIEAADKAYEASHDHLTGLANRWLLSERQRDAVAAAHGTTALLLLDLDHFKEINDTLGHAAGDVLLQEVGRRLSAFAGSRHVVGRLGGDEFAVLLTGLSSPEAAEPVAEAVLGLLAAPVEFEGLRLSVEGSLGVACHPQDAQTADELFRRADVAMYQAKSTRGQWLRYSAERDDSSVHRQALVAELRAALDLDQIVVHYQPQVDLDTGVLVGAEALCRWEHPTRGLLLPSDFVVVAEQSGLVRPFTLRVLDQAVSECVRWQGEGRAVSVAVNLSARSLLDRQLPDDVAAVLARWGLPPDRLVLEITETTATSELEVVEEVLAALRRLGVEISVDDFGTGYSSLAFLQRTAVHELKVDRTFVSGMLTSENDLALVRATVQLARSLGARSVAEGVESGAQAAALHEMGCDVAQGYWLSKPVPAAEVRRLLTLSTAEVARPATLPWPRPAQVRELRVAGS